MSALIAFSLQATVLTAAGWVLVVCCRIRPPRVALAIYQTVLCAAIALPVLLAAVADDPSPLVPALALTIDSAMATPIVEGVSFNWSTLLLAGLVAGAVVRLLLLAAGAIRLRAYRQRSHPPRTKRGVLAAVESEFGLHPEWCISREIDGAATYGLWRPIVLLPAGAVESDVSHLTMIARHELTHVARGDWLFVVIEELLRAVFWFHPAIWFLLDRIHLHREQTVDRAVVDRFGERALYAGALLDQAAWKSRELTATVLPWLKRGHLRARIVALVEGGTMSRSRARMLYAALVVVLGLVGVTAARAFPVPPDQGVVYEPGPDVTLPKLVRQVNPQYTREAMAAGITGVMEVSAVVEENGSVGEVVVTQSLDQTYGLDDKGVEAVRQWQFEPGQRQGHAVAVRVRITLRFTLK